MNHVTRIAPVVLLAAVATMAAPAQAKDGEVIRRGSCSASADWKLKASPDDGRIEVEGEVDSNKTGQTWKWKLVHNGSVSARGTATTTGPSGSFDVERTVVNVKGDDHLRFRASNADSGETCVGSLTF
jgi:hypothetical protein